MIPQFKVELHAKRVDASVSELSKQISDSLDPVLEALSTSIIESNTSDRGPESSAAILKIGSTFNSLLKKSEFYPTVLAFVSDLSNQVHEFAELYSDSPYKNTQLSDDDHEVLSDHAAIGVHIIEGHVDRTRAALNHFLSKSIGSANTRGLIRGVNDVVRRMTKVEPIAKDLVFSFFRLVCDLSYTKIEQVSPGAKYRYVGASQDSSRDFCVDLVKANRLYTREEIGKLDNGQVPGVMVSAGGYGCGHFWEIQ